MIEYFQGVFSSWESFKRWLGDPVTALLAPIVIGLFLNFSFLILRSYYQRLSKSRYKKSILKRIRFLSRSITLAAEGREHYGYYLLLVSLVAGIYVFCLTGMLIFLGQESPGNIAKIIAISLQYVVSFTVLVTLGLVVRWVRNTATPRDVIKKLKRDINENSSGMFNEYERQVLNALLDKLASQVKPTARDFFNRRDVKDVEQFIDSHDQASSASAVVTRLSENNGF